MASLLSANQVTLNSTVTTTNNGPLSIAHTGALTIPFGSVLTLDGPFTGSGGGLVSLGANLTTTSNNISWSGPITLTHDVTMGTGAGIGKYSFLTTVDQALLLEPKCGKRNHPIFGCC